MTEGAKAEPNKPIQRIAPPEGVVMHEKHRFGLDHIFHISVEPNRRVGREEYVDGTGLVYQPGGVTIQVGRRDLDAPTINRIGELAIEMHTTSVLRNHLQQVSQLRESAKVRLGSFAWGRTKATPNSTAAQEEVATKNEMVLTEATAMSTDTLQERQRVLEERKSALNDEAYALGVTLVQVLNGWGDVVTPPTEKLGEN